MIALAVLTTGALVALTVMIGTSSRNEQQRHVVIAHKACQDTMEALLSMSYADLCSLDDYENGPPAQAMVFSITAAGFPRQADGSLVNGTYSLIDISDQYGFAANSQKAFEIDVRVDHQNVHARMTTRRVQP